MYAEDRSESTLLAFPDPENLFGLGTAEPNFAMLRRSLTAIQNLEFGVGGGHELPELGSVGERLSDVVDLAPVVDASRVGNK